MVVLRACFISALFLFVDVSSHRNKKDYIFEKCAKIHQVSPRGLEAIFDMITVEGVKYQKCFIGCLFIEYEMLRSDDTVDENKLCEAIKTTWLIPEDQDLIVPRAVYCLRRGMQDRMYPGKQLQRPCEDYYYFFDCFLREIAPVKNQTTFPKYNDRYKRSLTNEPTYDGSTSSKLQSSSIGESLLTAIVSWIIKIVLNLFT